MRWYRSFALSAVFASQLLVGGSKVTWAQSQPSLQLGFDGQGLSAVTYAGNDVLHAKPMHVQMDLRHMFPPTPSTLPTGGPVVSFDAASQKVIAEDICAELSAKIDYCKKRWGRTLFYVNSTLRWDLSAEGDFQLHTLPAVIFQALHAKYPDVLRIPEQTTTRYHAYTAPYHEIMPPHNYLGTPDVVRAVYPDAFIVIRVADKPLIEKDSDALIAAVKSGDILMFRTWYDDPDNIPVKKILEEAAKK